ncbi:SDR family NAD(P)-dependent oxidoreductase [Streptomyces sp. A30]|uniref:SDR family NAD(P)-dependent oxidoreductase n=1 Tax=Streptomyces sp. A30 TaxID=2789273 RepID=UPI0039813675
MTGGASGIGLGIARRFAAEGMRVVIADVEQDALDRASAEIGALGVRTDVRDVTSVQALADATMAEFGAVHVVVNNAGVGPMARIADMELSDWRWLLEVNLWGVIHGVHTFLPLLQKNAEGGHIVNTSSMAGFSGMPNLGGYTVTKYGVVALTEVLAQELALDESVVGASVLIPGTVRTNIQLGSRNRPAELRGGRLADVNLQDADKDMGFRWLEPDDVGNLVVAGIRAGDLYIVTHPDMWPAVEPRLQAIAAAFDNTQNR